MMYGRSFAECEFAWVSFDKSSRIYKQNPTQLNRIHPTQKPVKLYEWLFKNYAKQGDKILDTHLGSGSIAIALDNVNKIENMQLSLVACELDKEYYESALKRIKRETIQTTIFQ